MVSFNSSHFGSFIEISPAYKCWIDCDKAETTTGHCAAPVEFNLCLAYFQNVPTV